MGSGEPDEIVSPIERRAQHEVVSPQGAERRRYNAPIHTGSVGPDNHDRVVTLGERVLERVGQPSTEITAYLWIKPCCAKPIEPSSHGVAAVGWGEPHNGSIAGTCGGG
jgi:hypothetical protein